MLPGNSQSRIRELLLVIFQLYRPKDKKCAVVLAKGQKKSFDLIYLSFLGDLLLSLLLRRLVFK